MKRFGFVLMSALLMVTGACGQEETVTEDEGGTLDVLAWHAVDVPVMVGIGLVEVEADLRREAPACRFSVSGNDQQPWFYVTKNELTINSEQCFDRLLTAMSRHGFIYVADPVSPHWRLRRWEDR